MNGLAPGRPSGLARHAITVLLAAFGYGAAVVVAAPIAVCLMEFAGRIDAGSSMRNFYRDEMAGVIFFGLVIAFVTALPGFVAALGIGRRRDWQSAWPYAAAGGLNGVAAMAILHLVMRFSGMLPWSMILSCIPAGFVGGLAYWLAAGRRLAHRRHEAG